MSCKLYLECYAGISGDMTVAALLDLGADENVLKEVLESLPLHGFETKISRVSKNGLDACDFDVILEHENHDHDMEYLHGHEHHHHHDHEHHHGHHHHEHRGLSEILGIIEESSMTKRGKEIAVRIFEIIAEAEAKAHGIPVENVHFHEVGAVDSIVDIVAVATCIDNLGIEEVIVPVLYEGRGMVRCQHGVIPIPVPATAAVVANYGLHLHHIDMEGEFVTPTGAAIVAALKTSDKLPSRYQVKKMGIGAGKRNYERASLLRAMLIEDAGEETDTIYKLESNIDDCSGEVLGYVMDLLLEAGAKDVHYTPVFMKKNRPGYQLNVICKEDMIETLETIIFNETTTIGIRKIPMERSVLKRENKTIHTSLGNAKVKVCSVPSGTRCYPEYSSVVELCREHQKSFQEVYQIILGECNSDL
ncbi:MAG: nickel pincer cofactor biosynthesis protein LarC [Anaerostipes sp.]|jgi:uncharacterized protein (TIGR00299 family) protein